MGLPVKLLAEGERALLVVHPHVRRLARPALLLLVLTPVASYAAASVPPGDGRATLRLALAVVAVVLALRFVVRPFVLWWSTVYVLTDQRVFERQGVVRRLGHDLPLAGVTDVVVAQRLADRLLGCGTLSVTTEGGTEFTVKDVPAVAVVQRSLLAVVDDVARRVAHPRRLPRAELGEPGLADGLDDDFGDRPGAGFGEGFDQGFDQEFDEEFDEAFGESGGGAARPGRREARRRDREHVRRLRELQAQVRRSPEPAGESTFESLLDPADPHLQGDRHQARDDGRDAGPDAPDADRGDDDRGDDDRGDDDRGDDHLDDHLDDDLDDHLDDDLDDDLDDGDGEPPQGARILRFPRRP